MTAPIDQPIRTGFRLALILLVLTGIASVYSLRLLFSVADLEMLAQTRGVASPDGEAPIDSVAVAARISTTLVLIGILTSLGVVALAWRFSRSALVARDLARAALEEENLQLEARVRERTVELQSLNDRLAAREERLRLALEAGRMGTFDWDLKSGRMQWSDDFAHHLGLEPQPFDDGFEPLVRYVVPEDGQGFVEHLLKARTVAGPFSHEYRIRRDEFQVRWMVLSGRTELQNERPSRMYGTIVDVTDRKRAETRLRKALTQLHDLHRHVQAVREEERTRIAREIHDELGQSLTGIRMEVSFVRQRLAKLEDRVSAEIMIGQTEQVTQMVDDTIRTVRRIASELRPGVLDELGLAAAIEWLGQDFGRRCGIDCIVSTEDMELDGTTATTVFRICQEALTNVARHAEATEVVVDLRLETRRLILTVADNGVGIRHQSDDSRRTLGLLGMRERAELAGGTLKIDGGGKGTIVELCIPRTSGEGDPE